MIKRIKAYLLSCKEELVKVTWPSRQETVQKTLLVIILSLAVAVYIGALDYVFNILLDLII